MTETNFLMLYFDAEITMRVLLLCMLVGAAAAFAPLLKVDEPIAERYIVKLKVNVQHFSMLQSVFEMLFRRVANGGRVAKEATAPPP